MITSLRRPNEQTSILKNDSTPYRFHLFSQPKEEEKNIHFLVTVWANGYADIQGEEIFSS